MRYTGTLFAVKDINLTVKFYEDLFDLKVEYDFGRCVSFDCGLHFQQDFDWLTGISVNEMKDKENNCEMVFEVGEFDHFIQKLKVRNDITLLHDIMEHTWGQRVIRFYDLNNHLIEVGESMKSVVQRFLSQDMTMEAIAERMDVKVSDVKTMLK